MKRQFCAYPSLHDTRTPKKTTGTERECPGPGNKERHLPRELGWTFGLPVALVPGGWFLFERKLEWWGGGRKRLCGKPLEFETTSLHPWSHHSQIRGTGGGISQELALALAMLHLSSTTALIPGVHSCPAPLHGGTSQAECSALASPMCNWVRKTKSVKIVNSG